MMIVLGDFSFPCRHKTFLPCALRPCIRLHRQALHQMSAQLLISTGEAIANTAAKVITIAKVSVVLFILSN